MKMKNLQKITFTVIALLSQAAFATKGLSPQQLNSNLLNAVLDNDLADATKALADVTKALAVGANPNMVIDLNPGTSSLLIAAVNQNNTAIAQALIAAKANVNFQDDQGATALIYAASNGNLALVNALLAAGANPNLQTNAANASTTALICAITWGNFTSVVEALLASPALTLKGLNRTYN